MNGRSNALFRTLPGRAIVIGLTIKIVVFVLQAIAGELPAFIGVVDTVASIALVAGGGVFLIRGVALAQRRLLWRVRRKLIISYIFIGFIPAILLVAFSLLGGAAAVFELQLVPGAERGCARWPIAPSRSPRRPRSRSSAPAAATWTGSSGSARSRRRASSRVRRSRSSKCAGRAASCRRAAGRLPAASTQPTITPPMVAAGPWSHVEAPSDVPDWVGCDGYKGLLAIASSRPATTTAAPATTTPTISVNGQEVPLGDRSAPTYLLIRALAFPDVRTPKYAVIVDLPVSGQVRRQFRDETGVELTGVGAVPSADGNVRPLVARADYAPPVMPVASAALPLPSYSLFEYRDWTTGMTSPLVASMQISVGGDLRPDLGRPGRDQPAQLRAGAAAGADADRRPVPHHRVRGARRRAGAGALDHRVGARAVRRHRARPPGGLHAQDRHQRARISSASWRNRSTR